MNPKEYFAEYNGEAVDVDHQFGNQCMDNAQNYALKVVGTSLFHGNAIDQWANFDPARFTRINYRDWQPVLGDIVIWGAPISPYTENGATKYYGHIGIYSEGPRNQFISFDQNWPVGSLCHFQSHNEYGVLGVLRPKSFIPQPVNPSPMPTPPIIDAFQFDGSKTVFFFGKFSSVEELVAAGYTTENIEHLSKARLIRQEDQKAVYLFFSVASQKFLQELETGYPVGEEVYKSIDFAALNQSASGISAEKLARIEAIINE